MVALAIYLGSYNAVNGIPSCGNGYLLQGLVLQYFGLADDAWITSDCDAIPSIYSPHGYTPNLEQAVVVALSAGTNLNCGNTFNQTLVQAVNGGPITENEVQRSLIRLYSSLVPVRGPLSPLWWNPYD